MGPAVDADGPERRRAFLRARLLQRAPEASAASGHHSRGAQLGAQESGRGPERRRRRQRALLAGGGVREQAARPLQSADASALHNRAERCARRDGARERRRGGGAPRRVRRRLAREGPLRAHRSRAGRGGARAVGRAAGARDVFRVLLAARFHLLGGRPRAPVPLPRTAHAFRARTLLVHCS